MAVPASSSIKTSLRCVRVELGPRSYDVLIGRGLLPHVVDWVTKRNLGRPVVIVPDSSLPPAYLAQLEVPFGKGMGDVVYEGELTKSMVNVAKLSSGLAQRKIGRTGTIIALGGGVIGDLASFVAATYLRGINLVQIPTTLLAMVDSSVGGKTGVNLPEGKNLVGAFHQPRLVVADLDTLETLPAREFAAGMAEVIKYGAIRDRALFNRVANGVTAEDDDLAEIVEKCVAMKAGVVERDEFETKGERALLNFGHTIGHAIEKATGYTRYLHGEAVALGMRAATWLSVWHSETQLPEAEAHAVEQALLDNDLPLTLDPTVDLETILAALGNDKKVSADGENRWVLLGQIGQARSGFRVDASLVQRALQALSAS